jgi:8-oxo-dGTP diphosphatase
MCAADDYLPDLDVRVIAFSLRKEHLHVLLAAVPGAGLEIPAARVGVSQPLEEAASSQLYRLTGLRETYLEQLYTYGETLGRPGARLVSVVYFALVPAPLAARENHASSMQQDALQADWFPLVSLPTLAREHAEILAYALRRLRYKLEYSAVGFQLLPEAFTLSELQRIYEMILGETLDKRNFRRRILQAGIIEPTALLRGGEGRPARLYRYRPDAVAEVKTRRLFP